MVAVRAAVAALAVLAMASTSARAAVVTTGAKVVEAKEHSFADEMLDSFVVGLQSKAKGASSVVAHPGGLFGVVAPPPSPQPAPTHRPRRPHRISPSL